MNLVADPQISQIPQIQDRHLQSASSAKSADYHSSLARSARKENGDIHYSLSRIEANQVLRPRARRRQQCIPRFG